MVDCCAENSVPCRKNIEEFPIKAYYIQKGFLDIGKSTSNFNGVILPLYDRERTICDCFKYRTKLDNEIFNKAVNAYAADEKKESCKFV